MQILWAEDAEPLLFTLPPPDSDRIVVAVEALADTGRGFVRRMLDQPEARLYIEGYAITFEVDGGVMFVLRIRPSNRSK